MIVVLFSLLTVVQQHPESTMAFTGGMRSPAYSATGRLAFELNGDLWVTAQGARSGWSALTGDNLTRVTSGPAWDTEPAWTPDGSELVFSSDRSGNFDLWRIPVGIEGNESDPTALTMTPEAESEPIVTADGSIVFVRGSGYRADLWVREASGSERRLTESPGAERSPTVSPDGRQVAYVAIRGGSRELCLGETAGGGDRVVLSDLQVEYPRWSPTGDVIVFVTRGRAPGVWVTPPDGRYRNLVSEKRAVAAWSPDGEWLTLAELPAQAPGYNGDPARLGDRKAGDVFSREGHLWVVRAHLLPDTDISEVSLAVPATRIVHNAEAFDRVWLRMERLYYGGRGREPWERLRSEYRDRALSAMTEEALESTIHEMLIERPPSRVEVSGSAAVSSAHHLATEAGVEVLRQGGNPVDAAVAVSFAIGVVEPDASGVGGYGEMVLYLRHMDQPVVIEFLSRVPEQAGLANALLLEDGDLPSDGPVLANVPGTVAGMWLAWKEYGSGNLKWSQLLAPAIRLAENGFVLDDAFPTTLAIESESFLKYESSRKLFFPNGDPLQPGDTLRNPDLAWTLRQIAEGGADAFYRGAVAHRMVADLRGQGNAMTLRDMERYFAAKREPVRGEYRGHTVFSAAPAAGGGVSLVAKLNSLDRFENPALYSEDVATAHAMIEAWKLVPSSSGRVADPGLWPVDTGPLLDREAAGRRWERCFDPGKSLSPDDLERRAAGEPACAEEATELSWGEQMSDCSVGLPCRRSGTTAFAVADSAGNMVAVTQTLGTWGGNFYVSPGLGFLYNDKLRSYSTDPDSYGARLPYARHGTSIAPTLAFRGTGHRLQPRFAVGAAGNAWITSAVYQMTAAMIDRDIGPQNALELPRFLIGSRRESGQTREVVVQIEDVFAPHVVRGLQKLGHRLQRISLRGELRMGYGAVVSIDGKRVRAGGDPRRSGAAGAIP